MTDAPSDVVAFWRDAGPDKWFAKSDAFDAEIRERFEALHHAAARGELDDWAADAEGALALLILLDQFPRNLWRGSPHAFATDGLARRLTRAAIAAGHDKAIPAELRPFFYLPFEHSEDPADQDFSIGLCQALKTDAGDTNTLTWAEAHRAIIVRFGRFPHRNRALGRETTAEEQAFLDAGGFAG